MPQKRIYNIGAHQVPQFIERLFELTLLFMTDDPIAKEILASDFGKE